MIELNHLKNNNEDYLSHFVFAFKIGLFFFICGVAFIVHSVLPWLQLPKFLNLSSTAGRVRRWNDYTLERMSK